jgi:hypothetical protein
MSWDKQNDAHYALYKFVRAQHFKFANSGQKIASFEDVGRWTNAFVLGAVGASPDVRRARAMDFAYEFNHYLFQFWDAVFEEEHDLDIAMANLAEKVIVANSTLSDCGDAIDGAYSFPSER